MSSKLTLVKDFGTKAFVSQTLKTHASLSHGNMVV